MTAPLSARAELERLLSEPIASARARAESAFDEIAGHRPIVLFGAGGLGRRIANRLRAIGRPPIAFADNDPTRANTEIAGVPVLLLADAVARYGADAVFVVAVWRSPATERMSERIERIVQLGGKHVTSFATLSWKYPEQFLPYYAIDLPHRVIEAKDDVMRAFELFSDDASRREYVAHIRLRLHLDFAGLADPASEPEYFAPDVYRLDDGERFVDCGAFDGDTVRSFLSLVPNFRGNVMAFEPDKESFARLETWRDSLPAKLRDRIDIVRAGAGARRERLTFHDGGGTGSAIGKGDVEIEVVALDEVAGGMRPTLMKIDTEGFEPEVLEGARRIITEHAPTLALCVYHRQDHPWRLPLTVASMQERYRYTLRSYCLDGWDLVLYATPATPRP